MADVQTKFKLYVNERFLFQLNDVHGQIENRKTLALAIAWRPSGDLNI